jgi:general secretion pathway protein E
MSSVPTTTSKAAPLDLQQIYTWLLADGMIRKAEVKELYAQSQAILKNTSGYMHPLCAVAHAKLPAAQPPHKMLTLDALCEWLAQRVGLPFIRIDPLRIDFTRWRTSCRPATRRASTSCRWN